MSFADLDVWDFPEGTARLVNCYTAESIRHPAKMHLQLCREIIKCYSKPGDLILDCMAGVGTTIVEGMILGRNVIGIEYEQKFADMAQANIDLVKKKMGFLNNLGQGSIIRGDSRELSKIFGDLQAENVIFSPPFGSIEAFHDKKWRDDNLPRKNASVSYSEDKRDEGNLANLNYGVVDSVITSPPFSGATKGSGISDAGHLNDPGLKNRVYGNLERSQGNIEGLPHGQIDSIITSPPYEEGIGHGGGKQNLPQEKGLFTNGKGSYSKSNENVGEMRGQTYLEAMSIIYQECWKVLKPNGLMILVVKNFVRAGKQVRLDNDTIKLCEQAGFTYVRRHYRKIRNPSFWITNAIQKWKKKHPNEEHPYPLYEDVLVFKKVSAEEAERERESVDSIMFSPPFSQQLGSGTDPAKFGSKGNWKADSKYSDDANNIGNFNYGMVGTVIFSPPFADKTMFKPKSDNWQGPDFSNHQYSTNPDNIGNMKYGGDLIGKAI